MSEVSVREARRQLLRFGKHKGQRIDEAPMDYVAGLLQGDWLWPSTQMAIERWLRYVRARPAEAIWPVAGRHKGEEIGDLPTAYLDWALSEMYLGEELEGLLKRELRQRALTVLVTTNPTDQSSARPVLRSELWLRDEPFDSRGFVPSEARGGEPRKPSAWTQRRPWQQIQAEEEALGQVWHHTGGQRLLWPEGLAEQPLAVSRDRQDRKRVYWAIVDGEPVVKGDDAHSDVSRLQQWDYALEAIDSESAAQDLDDLEDRRGKAETLVRLLAQDEGWNPDSNALLDELIATYDRRKDALERREEVFTDLPHQTVAEDDNEDVQRSNGRRRSRCRQRLGEDMEAARVHEVVRWLRSCRSLDELLDVAAWINRHNTDFREESLAKLRAWYSYLKAKTRTET
jgi:hypothetical protein